MEKGWSFIDYGTLKLGVSHKWLNEFTRVIKWYLYTESDGYPLKLPKFAILDCHCLADVLNLKNLKTIWGIKLIFACIEGTKNVILFWIMLDNTLGQSVYRIFYFWFVWLFNLNIGDPLLRCNCFLACLKISRKVFKHFWRISIACATVPPELYFFKVLYHDPVQ